MARGGGESGETLAQEWRKVKGEIRRRRDRTRDWTGSGLEELKEKV